MSLKEIVEKGVIPRTPNIEETKEGIKITKQQIEATKERTDISEKTKEHLLDSLGEDLEILETTLSILEK